MPDIRREEYLSAVVHNVRRALNTMNNNIDGVLSAAVNKKR